MNERQHGGRQGRATSRRTPNVCEIPGCGRPRSARGLCQTHHRQLRDTGAIHPIRPYRSRTPGTTKFAGLRLTPECVAQLEKTAERHGLSHGAAIAEILERWTAQGARPPRASPHGSGSARSKRPARPRR